LTIPAESASVYLKALTAFSKSLACHFQTSGRSHLARGPCVVNPCYIACFALRFGVCDPCEPGKPGIVSVGSL